MPKVPRPEITPEARAEIEAQQAMLSQIQDLLLAYGWSAVLTGLACIAVTAKKPVDRTALAAPLFALGRLPEAQDG